MAEYTESSTYQKEVNDVRQELLNRPDQYITFRDLVERFDKIDVEFNHSSWNLLQIYSNFNILIGTESKEYGMTSEEAIMKRVEELEVENKQFINCLTEIKNYCSISPSTVFPSDIIDIINKYNIDKTLE